MLKRGGREDTGNSSMQQKEIGQETKKNQAKKLKEGHCCFRIPEFIKDKLNIVFFAPSFHSSLLHDIYRWALLCEHEKVLRLRGLASVEDVISRGI